jgi:hypothetical protein
VNPFDININARTAELSRALAIYAEQSGKTPEEVTSKKGRDLAIELYRAYVALRGSSVHAHRVKILREVMDRGWGIIVSRKSYELADSIMGGQKVVMGNVTTGDGVIRIRTARIGKRGQRITGGRDGRGGRAASMDEYYGIDFQELDGDKRMNRQAVATAVEAMLRMRGSGSLGVEWLHKQWKKSTRGNFVLKNVNPRAEVQFVGDVVSKGGKNASITITGRAPGVTKYPQAVHRAINATIADTRNYTVARLMANRKKAGLK